MGEAKRRRQAAAAAGHVVSPRAAPEQSPSDEHPAGELDPRIQLIERYDAHARARNRLREIARKSGQWAGLPMDLEGESMVVHPSYPWAHILNAKRERRIAAHQGGELRVRNYFWSVRHRCYVWIAQRADGQCISIPDVGTGNSVDMEMRTMACSAAWGIEQESRALKLLGTLVRHHTFAHYLLTGQFLEHSPRSGITYMFRKLRPTIATKEGPDGRMRILTCLCLHPIGYYEQTWAGAMCPTDDVIAHLMLMRGDEHRYWKDANHIPPGRPNSGV